MAIRSILTLALSATAAAWQYASNYSASSFEARSLPTSYPLKVMCVGDSITVGVGDNGSGSPDHTQNGYRLFLYNKLTAAGINPTFIGTQTSGTNNPQPNMEGYGGQTINSILSNIRSNLILNQGPNLILLHAGTNDNDLPQNSDDPAILFADAPYRLGTLIDYILCYDPNAVVLVAELVGNKYNQAQTDAFNSQVPNVVGDRYMKGYKVRVVDMTMINGDLLSDLLHPTAAGYSIMADQWFKAIQNIPDSWWAPSQGTQTAFRSTIDTCSRDAVSFSPAINGNQIATGFHVDGDTADPPSKPYSSAMQWTPGYQDQGIPALGVGWAGSGVRLVDLDGDGRTDYLWVNYTQGSEGSVHAWINSGPSSWTPINNGDMIAFGYPGTSYIEFADLDGDKKPELILVANGMFKIYKNGGQNGNVWSWSELSNAENQLNYIFVNSAPFHWFADVTGDGYADLIVENSNTVLDLYVNQGPDGNGGFSWRQCKNIGIATGENMMWADIDGDGKADYISVDSDGGASGWLSGFTSGCSVNWIPINGRGPKSLALGVGKGSGVVRWVDMTGDKKADYVTVDDNGGTVHLYQNIGAMTAPDSDAIGGFGAAVRLADMDGTGLADYVSVTSYSGIAVALNGGPGADGNSWKFTIQGNGNVVALGYPSGTRHQVHLADMNGDGRDDYVFIDDDTGALHCYLNLGPSSDGGSWNWNIQGEIAIGVGGIGKGVRLADFDGDGRADYIYMDTDGSARVWLNGGPGDYLSNWQPINGGHVAALGVGANREDVQFADIDGDGKADFIWVHPDTGDMQVWWNLWDGKGVGWQGAGTIMSGQGYPGQAIRFARMALSGRNDYVAIHEDTGALNLWTNNCGNVIGTAYRPVAGRCGVAPMPTQTTTEPAPVHPTTSSTITPAPCTSTDGNGATAVYASNANGVCTGASRVVFNGQHVSVKVEKSSSAQVNGVTGSELFTSVSNALVNACPSPTGGTTVSSCGAPSAVPSIVRVDKSLGKVIKNGKLAIALPYVRYSTDAVRIALINSIARAAAISSLDSKNQKHIDNVICGPTGKGTQVCYDIDVQTIPSIVEAIYTKQDLSTHGNIQIENIEAQFALEGGADGGSYACTAEGLAADGAGLAGSVKQLSGLGLSEASGIIGPVIGFICLILDVTGQDNDAQANPGPSYGAPVWPSATIQPMPTFTDYPFTYSDAKNSGMTAYKASQTKDSRGFYPTDQPSLVLAVGTSVKIEAASSTKVNVGTYHGSALASSLSSIIASACPVPSGRTVTACSMPSSLPKIWYPQGNGIATDGEVEVSIPLVQYSTPKGLNAIIGAIVGTFAGSSDADGNSQPIHGECDAGCSPNGQYISNTQYQVAKSAQAIYVVQDQSTNGTQQLELMQVRLKFEAPDSPLSLVCDIGGLVLGATAFLSVIPGLEFLDFLGPAFDVACAGLSASGD